MTAFHDGRIGYLDILDIVSDVIDGHEAGEVTLDGVLDAERRARADADARIERRHRV